MRRALIFAGFAYDLSFAGLPYQDPTPQMQERWLFHKRVAEMITSCPALSFSALALHGVRPLDHSQKRRNPSGS
jgi:hypothetical protein